MTVRQKILKSLPDFVVRQYLDFKSRRKMRGYEGSEVECPACRSTFRIFASYGNPLRENAKCLRCDLAERGRLLWLYLERKTDLFTGKSKIKLLHFAPEKIMYEKFSQLPDIEYIPCDLFPEKYIFGGKIKVAKVDITAMPFADRSVDFIICCHVLEHIPDDALAMREIFRVLKPGGRGIFQVPIDYSKTKTYEDPSVTTPQDRHLAFGQHDHVRIYGTDYVDRLQNVGFEVTPDDFVKKFSDEDIYKYGLDKTELIYFCVARR